MKYFINVPVRKQNAKLKVQFAILYFNMLSMYVRFFFPYIKHMFI